jgi:hypothetical protein
MCVLHMSQVYYYYYTDSMKTKTAILFFFENVEWEIDTNQITQWFYCTPLKHLLPW